MKKSAFNKFQLSSIYRRFRPFSRDKKTASYLTLTMSLFTISFFGVFAIRPTLITATSLIKQVTDLKALNIEYENKINSIIRGQTEYEQIRNNIHIINSALPNNSSFTDLALGIEKFAELSRIKISQMQIDSVPISDLPHESKLSRYGFAIIARGDYPSLTSFISHLVNWRRIVNIKSMEFTKDTSTTSATLRFSLKGETYYEP